MKLQTKSIEELYQLFQQRPIISTDTRNITPGSLFFALKGANFNGNKFAQAALEKGASYVIVDEPVQLNSPERAVLVEDVLSCLQALARHHREQLNIPVIGITGTNGKTTSKELIYSVLSEKFNTHATKGNLNNHIGVPLTLLSMDRQTEIAIIEMGANHRHEIAQLCEIARPTVGLITNVGKAHLEGFGSYLGVKQTKSELYQFLVEHGGTIFIQGDNPELMEMAHQRGAEQLIRYGESPANELQGHLVEANPFLKLSWKTSSQSESIIQTQLTGTYNLENILAAACLGNYFGLSRQQINRGLEEYRPKNNRSQIIQSSSNRIIADFYNANASSMQAALNNLHALKAEKKAIILGDMFELGEESLQEHTNLRNLALSLGFTRSIFTGETFYSIRDQNAEYYPDKQALIEQLKKDPLSGYLILLKASRGMAFEDLLELL